MDRFRVAEYKLIRVDRREFLFLAAEKAIFETDPSTRRILERLSKKSEFSLEDLTHALPGASEKARKEAAKDLLKCHVVFPVQSPNRTKAVKIQNGPVPLKTLVLHVTEACNLHCAYCYEKKDGTDRRPAMGVRVAKKAVDFLLDRSGNFEEVVLVFFGGEPLLNMRTIRSVTEYAERMGKERGKRVNFALTTNGTLLTDRNIDFFEEHNVGVTVSLDGFEEVQDRYRRFPDGSPTYRVVLPRVRRLLEKARKRPVVARVTLVEKPGDLSATLDHLLGLGFVEAGFSPVTTGHPDFQLNNGQMDLLLDEFRRLAERFLEAVRERRFFGFSNLIDLLVSLHQGEVMAYPCGAGLGLFSVDARGRLYLCQRFTGQRAFCMGDVFHGFDEEKLAKFREEARIENKEECRSCWARTLCTGGCYHEACVREGSHLRPNTHYCEWIRKWTELGLETYCRIAAGWPEYLDLLSLSRGFGPEQIPSGPKERGAR